MFGGRGLNVGSVEVSVSAKYSGSDLKRLESDLKGAEKAASALDREMDQVSRNSIKGAKGASGGVSAYAKTTDSATKSTNRLNRETGRGAMLMSGLGSAAKAGAAAGLIGLALGLRKSYQEALEAQKVMRQTEAVIKSTGGSAKVTAEQLGNFSETLSNKIAVDDEAIQSAGNLLLTFKNIRNETGKGNDMFNQTLTAVMDMSAAMGQDAKSSAIQLGKAMNDPIKGLSALSRVGIQFNEQQKAEIETLVEKGKTLEAQKIIMREVMSQFAGSAKSQADPVKRLQIVLANLAENVGTALLPAIEKAATWLSNFITQFMKGKGAGGEFRKTMEDIWEIAKNLWPTIKLVGSIVGDIVRAFASLPAPVQTALVSLGLVAGLAAKFGVLAAVFTKVWAAAKTLFMMFRVAPMLMGPLGIALAVAVTAAVLIIKNWGWVKKTLGNVWGWMKTAFKNVADFVVSAAKKGFLGPTFWIIANWDKVKNFFRELPGKIKSFFSGLGRTIAAPFTWAFDKIGKGVDRVLGWISDVKNAVTGLPGKIGGIIGLSQGGVIPAYANGGRVGPTAGGPRMFLAGEGRKDEWVISQEGNRRRNVGYLVEAAQALGVSMFRKGGKISKGQQNKLRQLEGQMANLENKYSYNDRRFGMDGEYSRAEVQNLVGIKSAMIKNLRQQQGIKKSRDRFWQIKQLELDKKELWQRLKEGAESAAGSTGPSFSEQLSAFNAERFAMLSSFGGNVRARGNNRGSAPQMMNNSGGGKTINIVQNYQKPPEDPHAWTRKVQHEVGALV